MREKNKMITISFTGTVEELSQHVEELNQVFRNGKTPEFATEDDSPDYLAEMKGMSIEDNNLTKRGGKRSGAGRKKRRTKKEMKAAQELETKKELETEKESETQTAIEVNDTPKLDELTPSPFIADEMPVKAEPANKDIMDEFLSNNAKAQEDAMTYEDVKKCVGKFVEAKKQSGADYFAEMKGILALFDAEKVNEIPAQMWGTFIAKINDSLSA